MSENGKKPWEKVVYSDEWRALLTIQQNRQEQFFLFRLLSKDLNVEGDRFLYDLARENYVSLLA